MIQKLLLGKFLSSYSTRIKAGAELIETLSSSLYKNAYYVLDELISNAYDADATEVDVRVSENEIVISDNGEGMDREGLEDFLWLGYSEKQRDRRTGKFNRYKIGKFGIGKLSMHVICDVCELRTTKNGVTSSLTLDFGRILSHKGLGEERIKVRETPTKEGVVGTTVHLIGLKKKIDESRAIKRITRNMPLSPVFRIRFNDKTLKPEDIIKGKAYEIHLDLPLIGRVDGKLIHSDTPLGEFAGIYVKVHGRTVNADAPNIFGLMNTIKRPDTFVARVYGIVSADGLDDTVLATRNGFKEDAPKYLEFKQAMLREIRKITRDIIEKQSDEELQYEMSQLGDVVRHQIGKMLKGADLPDDFLARYSERPDIEEIRATIREIEKKKAKQRRKAGRNKDLEHKKRESNPIREGKRQIKIGRYGFGFELATIGKEAYECVLDDQKAVFYINVDHPQYLFSRKEGSLSHHFRRVIVFEIARSISGGSSAEFVTQYQSMMQQNISK
ncbi:MAG: ATP-binding protein [Candidatus Bathyarchaeota archaeon]|nr:ATP-binding protein [Candidatus Bathyarchaeota archaeon]